MMLVVGGQGLIGSAVAERAAGDGAEVHVLVRRSGPAPFGAVVHVGDAREADLGLVEEDAAGLAADVRQIVVAAGCVDLEASLADARDQHLAPLLGVLDFARRCRRLDALVYVSSYLAVGEVTHRVRSADLPVRPRLRNFYEWAKYEGERLVRESGLPVRVVRPGHVLDAEDGSRRTSAPVGILAALPHLTAGWPLPVRAEARYWCAPVDFVARVVLAVAAAGPAARSAWAVDPASPTLGELLDMLAFRHGLRVRQVGVGRATRWWAGAAGRLLRADAPTGLAPYLDGATELDLSCLDALVDAGLAVPASRDYVCETVDHFVESLAGLP